MTLENTPPPNTPFSQLKESIDAYTKGRELVTKQQEEQIVAAVEPFRRTMAIESELLPKDVYERILQTTHALIVLEDTSLSLLGPKSEHQDTIRQAQHKLIVDLAANVALNGTYNKREIVASALTTSAQGLATYQEVCKIRPESPHYFMERILPSANPTIKKE